MSSSPNSETTTPAVNIVNHEEGYSIVVSDPKIMGGTPVIRGTRIPVRLVAEMRRQGAAVEEILAGYPSLTAELIALAEIHVQAHPQRALKTKTRLPRGARVIARKTYPLERAS